MFRKGITNSEIKMAAYGFKREVVLQRLTDAIRHAIDHDMRVIFFPVDSTRSDLDFLQEVYARAIEAGANEVAVVDTIGACAPEAVESLIRTVRGWIGYWPEFQAELASHGKYLPTYVTQEFEAYLKCGLLEHG